MQSLPIRLLALSRFGFILGLTSIGALLGGCVAQVDVSGSAGGVNDSDAVTPCDEQNVRDLVTKASPCFAGDVGIGSPSFAPIYLGYLTQLKLCTGAGPSATQAEEAITKPAAAAAGSLSCTASPSILFVNGPTETEGTAMWNAIQGACPAAGKLPRPPFKITLDAKGKVASVTTDPTSPPSPALSQDLTDCMMKALAAPSFSCLAGLEICSGFGGDP